MVTAVELPGLELEPVYCGICGRKLRTAESRLRGRGPTCDEKVSPARGRDHSPRRQAVRSRGGTAQPAAPDPDDPTLFDPTPAAGS